MFDCAMWRSTFEGSHGRVACLAGCHRQSRDSQFQKILDKVRWGRAGDATINMINSTWSNAVAGSTTKLRIRKIAVNEINQKELDAIAMPEHTFQAEDVFLTNNAAVNKQAVLMLRAAVDLEVTLKQKAVVILTRKAQGVSPGTRGVVQDIVSREMDIEGRMHSVRAVLCDFGGRAVEVGTARFPAFNGSGTEVAYCEQIPLLLGWAITVHRAQGLTLNAVEIDFSVDTWSTCGLVYTALSRARRLASLRVRGLRRDLIRVSRFAVAYYEKCLKDCGVAAEDDGRPPIEV